MPFTILALAPLLFAEATPAPGLAIRPGQTIIFRLEGDRPVAVGKGKKAAPGQLRATLKVRNGQTMLEITNNTQQWLNYRATITPRGRPPQRTSVCTIMSDNRSAFEAWPGPIEMVTIFDFRPAPETGLSCG